MKLSNLMGEQASLIGVKMESRLGASNKHLEHISLNDDFIKQAEKTNHASHNHLSGGYTLHGSYSNQHTHSPTSKNRNLDLKSIFTSRFNNSFSNLANMFGIRNKPHHHSRHINGGNQNTNKSSSTIADSTKSPELPGQIKKSIFVLSFILSAMLAWLVAIYLIRHNEHKDLSRTEWTTYMVGSRSDQQQINQQPIKSYDQPIIINSRQAQALPQSSFNPYAFPQSTPDNSNIFTPNNNPNPIFNGQPPVVLFNPNIPSPADTYYRPNGTYAMPIQPSNWSSTPVSMPPVPSSASSNYCNPNQQYGASANQMYTFNAVEQAPSPHSSPVSHAPKARHRVIVTR